MTAAPRPGIGREGLTPAVLGLAPKILLRPMREVDLAEVIVVERAAYPFPWAEGIFRDCLDAGYHCWVMAAGRALIGHAVMSVAVGECHILNLCVHPSWQRRRLGRTMLRRILQHGHGRGADTCFLEVRASNLRAINLYEQEGFSEVGRRRGYYPASKGREDAILMAKPL